ncbi:hypothetical protein QX204_00615 [Nocardia sp. PE-7]|nr:hypothetical protein [Nocardia sp. PE-7]WKG10048.1 hypothetical protein QX204_00615 [Nocardia sp. PE-7]
MDAERQRQVHGSPVLVCAMIAEPVAATSARIRPIASTEPEE